MPSHNLYYVISNDGQKFGPADQVQLQAWMKEGRLTASTQLEEKSTGRRFPAVQVLSPSAVPPPIAPLPVPPPSVASPSKAPPSGVNPSFGLKTTQMPARRTDHIVLIAISAVLFLFMGWHFVTHIFAQQTSLSTYHSGRYGAIEQLLDLYPLLDLPILALFGYLFVQAVRGKK